MLIKNSSNNKSSMCTHRHTYMEYESILLFSDGYLFADVFFPIVYRNDIGKRR